MNRAGDIYAIAKNCYSCHMVGYPKLVAAGHKPGSTGFEFSSWSAGEVRHNFQQDQTTNAEAPTLWIRRTGGTPQQRQRIKFVVGMLVELETALRNRAKCTQPADAAYAAQMGGRVVQLNGKIAQVGTAQTGAVAGIVGPLINGIFTIKKGDQKPYAKAANQVATQAKPFVKAHDGSQLANIDSMLAGTEPKGDVYQP